MPMIRKVYKRNPDTSCHRMKLNNYDQTVTKAFFENHRMHSTQQATAKIRRIND